MGAIRKINYRLDTMDLINKNNLQTQFLSFHINLPITTHQLILLGEKLLGLSVFLMSYHLMRNRLRASNE